MFDEKRHMKILSECCKKAAFYIDLALSGWKDYDSHVSRAEEYLRCIEQEVSALRRSANTYNDLGEICHD